MTIAPHYNQQRTNAATSKNSKQNHEAYLTLQQTHQHILDATNIKVAVSKTNSK
jgi:hypothetical protein